MSLQELLGTYMQPAEPDSGWDSAEPDSGWDSVAD